MSRKTAINIFGAAVLQAGNFFVPLALLPWFAKTLGVSGYGQIAYITAVVAYFLMLVDWGFNLSATKAISIQRDCKHARSRIFWETIVARILLALVGAVGMEFLCYLLEVVDTSNYRWAFIAVWANALNPSFYFQGIEKIARMAIIQTGIKACSIPLVMLTVTSDIDLASAIGVPACVFLAAALTNLLTLLMSGQVVWVTPNRCALISAYVNGWPLFLATAAISLYTNTNTVILGLVADDVAVGYFSSAMVFIKAAHGLYQPISQVLFPKMSYKFIHDPNGAHSIFFRLLKLQSAVTFFGGLALVIVAPWLVEVLLGQGFEQVIELLYWLSPTVMLIGISNVLGIQAMIPLGYNQAFTRIVMVSGLLNIALITPLGSVFGAEGGAMAVLISEGCVTLLLARFLLRHEPKLFGRIV